MIELEATRLRNVALFKDQIIPISKSSGLTVITGHNKDSTVANDQRNAAGKSLLFSVIPNLFYQAAPLSVKKNSKRDILLNKKSCTSIIFRSRGTRYKIDQYPSKYVLHEEQAGKFVDQQVRTDKLQRQALAKAFYLTPLEFYSYVYIQTQRPLDFQIGSPAQRLDFITEIFQLDAYDKLRQYFNQKVTAIKDQEIRFQVISTKLQSVYSSLKELEWDAQSTSRLKQLRQDVAALTKEAAKQQQLTQDLAVLLQAMDQVLRIDQKLDTLRQDYPFKTSPQEILVKLKHELKILRAVEQHERDKLQYDKQLNKVKEQLGALTVPTLSKDKALKQLEISRSRCYNLQQQLKDIEIDKKTIESLDKQIQKIKAELDSLHLSKQQRKTVNLDQKLAKAQQLMAMERVLHKCDDAVCPTCKQDIDVKAIKQLVAEGKRLYKQLKQIEQYQQLKTSLKELTIKRSKYIIQDDAQLRHKLDQHKKRVKQLQQDIDTITKYSDLQSTLQDLKQNKPHPIKDIPIFDLTIEQCEHYIEQCQQVLRLLSSKQSLYDASRQVKDYKLLDLCKNPRLLKSNRKKLAKEVTKQERITQELAKKVQAFSKDLRTLELSRERYAVLETQRLELEAELTQIKPILDKRKIYETLVKAYSKKGLKIQAARTVIKLLESKLNEYANLIFFEPFKFKLEIVAQGISCQVDRGRGEPTDVCLLSGSETNCFRLLFMIGMLSLVPADRRTNFVVLDEADSAMDDSARHMFINNFLPALKEVVPHVFVITPGDPHIYPNADIWVVVKENGTSKVLT